MNHATRDVRASTARCASSMPRRGIHAVVALVLAPALAVLAPSASAQDGAEQAEPDEHPVSAFNLDNPRVKHSVPLERVRKGIPRDDPRDAIPPIYKPRYVSAKNARLGDEDRVIGFAHGGQARAYPLKILNGHEIVIDTIGGIPICVSYCPLCGTGAVFDRRVGGRTLTFGVSGYLYESDLLMWDHETESFWSQIEGVAVVGPLTGTKLKWLNSVNTSWAAWEEAHPDTLVLRGPRPAFMYERNPYGDYDKQDRVRFPVLNRDTAKRYHSKTRVFGIRLGGVVRAYPQPELEKAPHRFTQRFGKRTLTIRYDAVGENMTATDEKGQPVIVLAAYWFAWYAFHPDTEVFTADSLSKEKPGEGGAPNPAADPKSGSEEF